MPIYPTTLKSGERRYDAIVHVPKPEGGKRQLQKRFKLKKHAQQWLDKMSVDVTEGTFRELIKASFYQFTNDFWKPTYLNPFHLKHSTMKSYEANIDKHLIPKLGHYPMTAITKAEINRLKTDLSRVLNSPKNVLGQLRKMLSDAVENNYLRISPMEGMKKLGGRNDSEGQRRGQALTPDQIHLLLNASKENEEGKSQPLLNSEAKLMIWTAILTGLRQGEEFGLQWPDIDFEANVIRVRQALYWNFGKEQKRNGQGLKYLLISPKSKYAIRDIDLSPELKKMLLEHRLRAKDKEGFVFRSSKGSPVLPNNFYSRTFKPAARAIGLPDLRWHDLRHTFGSLKLAQKESLFYVQRQMGHSSIQITCDIYGHLEEQQPEAARKTDALIFGSAK